MLPSVRHHVERRLGCGAVGLQVRQGGAAGARRRGGSHERAARKRRRRPRARVRLAIARLRPQ